MVQLLRDRQTKYPVAKKLKPLIRGSRIGAGMRQRPFKQRGIVETVTETVFHPGKAPISQ